MTKDASNYISICLNDRVDWLTPTQVVSISNELSTLTVKKFEKNGYPLLELVMLKGGKGEIAYLKDYSISQRPHARRIIFEFPLSLTVDEMRFFSEGVMRLFKDKVEGDLEVAFDGVFKRITRKPYKEWAASKSSSFNFLRNAKFRERTFADSAPHGTFSTRPAYKKKRDRWIRNCYQFYTKRGVGSETAYDKIAEGLAKRPLNSFGEWPKRKRDPVSGKWKPAGKSPLELSAETIKDIVQRKS